MMKNQLKKVNEYDFPLSSKEEKNICLFNVIKIEKINQSDSDKENSVNKIKNGNKSNLEFLNKKRDKKEKGIIINEKVQKQAVPWTKEEDKLLLNTAKLFNEKNWKKIASLFEGRTSIQCSSRYHRIKPGLSKGHFTKEEDSKLISLYNIYGRKWNLIAKNMKNRSGKQVRDRFLNSLAPGVNKAKFTNEEDMKILKYYKIYGKSWSKIAKYINGRTGDMIKNRFYSSLYKLYENNNYLIEENINQNNEPNKKNKNNIQQTKDISSVLNQNNFLHNDNLIKNNENTFFWNNNINININNNPNLMFINNNYNYHPSNITNLVLSNLLLTNDNTINRNNYNENLNFENYNNDCYFKKIESFNNVYNLNSCINSNLMNANKIIPYCSTAKLNYINNVNINQISNEYNYPLSPCLSLFQKM
jgi:myb proto-oncogene protein